MLLTEEDCRMAMVLIALLGGGDYAPEGLAGFGMYPVVVDLTRLISYRTHDHLWSRSRWPIGFLEAIQYRSSCIRRRTLSHSWANG